MTRAMTVLPPQTIFVYVVSVWHYQLGGCTLSTTTGITGRETGECRTSTTGRTSVGAYLKACRE